MMLSPQTSGTALRAQSLYWVCPSPSRAVSIPHGSFEWGEIYDTSIKFGPQRDIRALKSVYIFDGPGEVEPFLAEHDYLIRILFEAPDPIRKVFGPVPLHLSLHHDPEEDWAELFIVIKSPYSAAETIRREGQLDKIWFLKKMNETRGRLNFTEKPV